jgi:hypothetical protein
MKALLFLSIFLLAACSGSNDETGAAEEVEEAADVLGDSYHDSIDAAEAVEEELMKAKDDLDAAIQEAEGGSEG